MQINTEKLIPASIYCGSLSLITPPLIGYNLQALYQLQPSSTSTLTPWIRANLRMMPTQLVLRSGQLAIASQLRERTNPWVGFAFMGVMQGIIYGHANTNWVRHLNLPVGAKPNLLRGVLFAASRDTISQGIPFAFRDNGPAAVALASIGATVASQGFHNCQTIMQVKSYLGYREAFLAGWKRHGFTLFYTGYQARLVMMSSINALNYLLLKDLWSNK